MALFDPNLSSKDNVSSHTCPAIELASYNIAINTTVGQEKFGNRSNYFIIKDIIAGEFRQDIATKIAEEKYLVLKLEPPFVLLKGEQPHYNTAAKWFFQFSLITTCIVHRELKLIDEEDVYFLAALAFIYQDVTPLMAMKSRFPNISDKYYWLYLSAYPTLFFATMSVEMYRRRHKRDLALVWLKNITSTLTEVDVTHTLHCRPTYILPTGERIFSCCYSGGMCRQARKEDAETEAKKQENDKIITTIKKASFMPQEEEEEKKVTLVNRGSHYTFINEEKEMRAQLLLPPAKCCTAAAVPYLNVGLTNFQSALRRYDKSVTKLVKIILSNGGVIAGGFINSIVNPSFRMYELTAEVLHTNSRDYPEYSPYNTYGDFTPVLDNKGKLSFNHRFYPWSRSQTFMAEFITLLEAYFWQYPSFTMSEELYGYLHTKESELSSYDLNQGLDKYKEYLRVINGRLYLLYFITTNDIDVFVTKDSSNASSIPHMIDALRKVYMGKQRDHHSINIYHTENAISFQGGVVSLKTQLIKREYLGTAEILAGFDLDSCRVALIPDLKYKYGQVVALHSYITAVSLGINNIVPTRQSKSFNLRILKYQRRGFAPFVPFTIKHPFPKQSMKLAHSFNELCYYKCQKHRWTEPGELCDYSDEIINLIVNKDNSKYSMDMLKEGESLDGNLKLIAAGIKSPLMRDVYYLVQLVEHAYTISLFEAEHGLESRLRSLYNKFHILVGTSHWRTVDPGTQFTGSFNPTYVDYFAGTEKESVYPPKLNLEALLLATLKSFPATLVNVVLQYKGTELEEIYAKILKYGRKLVDALDNEGEIFRIDDELSDIMIVIRKIFPDHPSFSQEEDKAADRMGSYDQAGGDSSSEDEIVRRPRSGLGLAPRPRKSRSIKRRTYKDSSEDSEEDSNQDNGEEEDEDSNQDNEEEEDSNQDNEEEENSNQDNEEEEDSNQEEEEEEEDSNQEEEEDEEDSNQEEKEEEEDSNENNEKEEEEEEDSNENNEKEEEEEEDSNENSEKEEEEEQNENEKEGPFKNPFNYCVVFDEKGKGTVRLREIVSSIILQEDNISEQYNLKRNSLTPNHKICEDEEESS